MNDTILAPERMPERDAQGWAQHPDLENLLQDVEDPERIDMDADVPLDLDKIKAAGYEAAFVLMADQRTETDAEWHRYFIEGEPDASGWEPDAPDGEGWRLVAVYDTEQGEGPAAMFVRTRDSDFIDDPGKYPDTEVQQ